MKLLDRYLGWAVIGGTLATLAVLLPLLGFFILAEELDDVGQNNYQLIDALAFVALSLPRYAHQILPIATLIGALIGLGALASRSELVAMRAAGVSIARIVVAALKAGLLLAILTLAVGELVVPASEQKALHWRSDAQSGQVTLKTPYGFWARDGDSYINIRAILPGANLRDISIYEFDDDQHLTQATRADSAIYKGGRWVLDGISRSRISLEGVQVSPVESTEWESLLNPGLLRVVIVEPHMLPIWGLMRYVSYMDANGQDADAYEVALWGKIVHPFLVLAMVFLSIPILFGTARSASIGSRVLLGVMVGIGFYVVSRAFSYLALLFGFSAWLAAVLPPLLFILGALWVLRRVG